MPVISVFEHEYLESGKLYNNVLFREHHLIALQNFNEKNKNKFFTNGYKKVKFSNYVGVIQIGNTTIEILPKIDKSDDATKWHRVLIDMLKFCGYLRLEYLTKANLSLLHTSLFDIFIESYLQEVKALLMNGLIKSYNRIEDNLPFLKGKLVIHKQLKYNSVNKQNFAVEFDNYDYNNLHNQILLKALNVIRRINYNNSYRDKIENLLISFPIIDEIRVTENTFLRLPITRKTQSYTHALTLAKLILLHYSPDIRNGGDEVLSILFDMNKLFEEYIYRRLKAVEERDFLVKKERKIFWQTKDKTYKTINADIIIKTLKNNYIVDTKWKVINDNKPSDDDLKQMFAYNHSYESIRSVLLYPKVDAESYVPGTFVNNEVKFQKTYLGHGCSLAFVDIFDENSRLNRNIGIKIKNILSNN